MYTCIHLNSFAFPSINMAAAGPAGFPSHSGTDWVLFTGQPGSGKTTAVLALAKELELGGVRVRGFVTEEVLGEDGCRVGFDVVTIPDARRGVLSRKGGPPLHPKTGQYSVDVEAFEQLALPTLVIDDEQDLSTGRVYILDEIGRYEYAYVYMRK